MINLRKIFTASDFQCIVNSANQSQANQPVTCWPIDSNIGLPWLGPPRSYTSARLICVNDAGIGNLG